MRKVLLVWMLTFMLMMAMSMFVRAAEAVPSDEFNPDHLIVNGVALAPLISVIISVLKGWTKFDSKYIPLINVILGAVGVLVVAVVNEGMSFASALIMTLGVVLGSQVFHETFGHAAVIVKELFSGKQKTTE